MAQIISDDEFDSAFSRKVDKGSTGAGFISDEEYYSALSPAGLVEPEATFSDYLKTVPATATDIAIGGVEGLAAGIGAFSGDYDLARTIAEFRTDVNDSFGITAPDKENGWMADLTFKVGSALGSSIPFLGAAIASKNPSLAIRGIATGATLAMAGQTVRDDYMATKGINPSEASDEDMFESTKAGAIGAVPIALAERLGAGAILSAFKGGAIPAGKVVERIAQYATAAAGEGLTEAAQSGIVNTIAAYVSKYDEDRPITQGMAESALIGAIVGGGLNMSIDAVSSKVAQSDRLVAGIRDNSINAKDVIDEDLGSKFTAIAMENNSIPEVETLQQRIETDPNSFRNWVSTVATPLSRRLGKAGKEVVREFRKFEMNTGIKTNEYRKAVAPFSKKLLELKKNSPEDYKILSLGLMNSAELNADLPQSVQKDLEIKSQTQPEFARSSSENLMFSSNPNADVINNQITGAREAIAGMGLNTKIEIIEEGSSYYNPNTNTIGISAIEADGTTVGHELFHAAYMTKVKDDVELQVVTRNMFDSVIRASDAGSGLQTKLSNFISRYDENVQSEEFLAQAVGELASSYSTLDMNTKTRIKVWINQVAQKIGISSVFKEAETDAEVIATLNKFARFSGEPEALSGFIDKGFVKEMMDPTGEQAVMGESFRASKLQLPDFSMLPKNIFSNKSSKYSRITSANTFDMAELVGRLKSENARVSFWAADQFGSGTYKDPVSGKSYDLDGGISFPLDKKGQRKDYVWASTANKSIQKMLKESDYVFLVSGKPDSQMLFNKQLHQIVLDRAKKQYGSMDKALDKILKLADGDGRKNKQIDAMRAMRKSGADAFFRDSSNTKIGNFLKTLKGQYDIKTESAYREAIRSIMPDTNDLRDGFLKENDFNFLDVMGVIKPNGVVDNQSSGHGTYRDGVRGEFIGIPDVKVAAHDLFTDEAKGSFKDLMVSNSIASKIKKFKKETGKNPSQSQIAQFSQKTLDYASQFMDMPTKYHGVYSGGTVGYKTRDAESFINPYPVQDDAGNSITAENVEAGASAIRDPRFQIASQNEINQGISDEALAIMAKHGMMGDYQTVRGVLDSIGSEYADLGLDIGMLQGYFPREVSDLKGLKGSFGMPTGIVDQELARYEKATGQKMSTVERQMMYEKLARSRLYRSGIGQPSNLKERKLALLNEGQLQYYSSPIRALDSYIDRMVNSIETKKLIGDSASGKTAGVDPISGSLGKVMDELAKNGRLRQDQIGVVQGAVAARFGQHGSQMGWLKGTKNAGYLAAMGNFGSTLTQLGDFYFTAVQNGIIPTIEAVMGKKNITIEDLGVAKDRVSIETQDSNGFLADSVNWVFKATGLTAMDNFAKNTNINAAHKVLTKGAKSNTQSNAYKKTLIRLKKTQGTDAYKTIADLKDGVKSDYVLEALYNELSNVAPISLTEMPEKYAGNPNLRIMWSLKSYTIKQFNFIREEAVSKIHLGIVNNDPKMIAEGSIATMKILAFATVANGSADVLKAIMFNRELDDEDMLLNNMLRIFGITKFTAVQAKREGLGSAILKTIAPPQFSMINDVVKDAVNMENIQDMRSTKFVPLAGKLYYWQAGRGVEVEERLSRLRD